MKIYAYKKITTNEYPRFEGDIRLEHPEIGEEFYCPDTYVEVYESVAPVANPDKEIIVEESPVLIEGKFRQSFKIVQRTETPKPLITYGLTSRPKPPTGNTTIFPTEATGRIEVNILKKV